MGCRGADAGVDDVGGRGGAGAVMWLEWGGREQGSGRGEAEKGVREGEKRNGGWVEKEKWG